MKYSHRYPVEFKFHSNIQSNRKSINKSIQTSTRTSRGTKIPVEHPPENSFWYVLLSNFFCLTIHPSPSLLNLHDKTSINCNFSNDGIGRTEHQFQRVWNELQLCVLTFQKGNILNSKKFLRIHKLDISVFKGLRSGIRVKVSGMEEFIVCR